MHSLSMYQKLFSATIIVAALFSSEAYCNSLFKAHDLQQPGNVADQTTRFLARHLSQLYPSAALSIDAKPPSKGLKLRKCDSPLNFEPPTRIQSRFTVRVSCPQPSWKIYVSTNISVTLPVVTAATPLSKGKLITNNMLKFQPMDILPLRGQFFLSTSNILGYSPKRSIRKDDVIRPQTLEAATLVLKGDAVVIEAVRSSITIRSIGTALENGKEGEQIKVKNDKSGKLIKAFVVSQGLVRTPG